MDSIGEACRNLEHEFYDKYPDIPWAVIIATRNILIHEYWEVDLDQVWHTAKHDLSGLKKSLTKVISSVVEKSSHQI